MIITYLFLNLPEFILWTWGQYSISLLLISVSCFGLHDKSLINSLQLQIGSAFQIWRSSAGVWDFTLLFKLWEKWGYGNLREIRAEQPLKSSLEVNKKQSDCLSLIAMMFYSFSEAISMPKLPACSFTLLISYSSSFLGNLNSRDKRRGP